MPIRRRHQQHRHIAGWIRCARVCISGMLADGNWVPMTQKVGATPHCDTASRLPRVSHPWARLRGGGSPPPSPRVASLRWSTATAGTTRKLLCAGYSATLEVVTAPCLRCPLRRLHCRLRAAQIPAVSSQMTWFAASVALAVSEGARRSLRSALRARRVGILC